VSDLVLCVIYRIRRWNARGEIASKVCPTRTQHIFSIEKKWIWRITLNIQSMSPGSAE